MANTYYKAVQIDEEELDVQLKRLIDAAELVIERVKEVETVREKPILIKDRIKEAHEYYYGIGRAKQPHKALQIYTEEAENNKNPTALNALGKVYLEGVIVARDIQKAYSYFA